MPCAPGPGGVAAKQMYMPGKPVSNGVDARSRCSAGATSGRNAPTRARSETVTRPPSDGSPSSGRASGRGRSPRWCGCPTDLVGGLQDGHPQTSLGEGDRGREAVWSGADDDRGAHATAVGAVFGVRLAASDQVTSVGIGPLGSHGCSATASATFQVPRSITPSAASMTL